MENLYQIKRICCVGAGYVGGPTMAVIADNCPEIEINVVDRNVERIKSWNSKDLSKLPVFEKGLSEIISRTRDKNLFFNTQIDFAIENADMIFISVNTPIKSIGLGAGQTSDLKWVESCARQISIKAKGHTIVVEKSTLPVRTAKTIKDILFASEDQLAVNNKKTFSVLSNPEFLAEGSAISDLEEPDRILIGGEDSKSIDTLAAIYCKWVPLEKIIKTNLWSSELSKLTSNAFLAQRISSINSISAICEASGADVYEVANAVGKDSRIGAKFLKPGPGFGGSCFKKDILNLVYLCNFFGLKEVANFWESIVNINQWQQDRIYKKIVESLFGNISGKKIAILGFAFKAGTNDTRESPAITISRNLLIEGAELAIHDPKVQSEQIASSLEYSYEIKESDSQDLITNERRWRFYKDIYKAAEDSHALIIITEWNEYRELDWEKISKKMYKPSWVFDTRGILDKSNIQKYGIKIWQLGDGSGND
tara:strand:+ start:1904 stop:3346 length:1443 start_codon:yes stop_codon:yes gene_type:complete